MALNFIDTKLAVFKRKHVAGICAALGLDRDRLTSFSVDIGDVDEPSTARIEILLTKEELRAIVAVISQDDEVKE